MGILFGGVYLTEQLKNTYPCCGHKFVLKGGSVRAPPAVSQGVQILQAANLSAQKHVVVRM